MHENEKPKLHSYSIGLKTAYQSIKGAVKDFYRVKQAYFKDKLNIFDVFLQ